MDNNKLDTITNLFEGKEIRSVWDSEKEEYFFSVVDVIGALTDNEYVKARNYWKWLKTSLNKEGSELVSKTNQLRMRSQKDGKNYLTDTLDTKGILRLIESELIEEIFFNEKSISTNMNPLSLAYFSAAEPFLP